VDNNPKATLRRLEQSGRLFSSGMLAMTERDWIDCVHPREMLEFLRGKTSLRKLRLFGVVCCRRIWKSLHDKRSRAAVELAELYADDELTAKRLIAAERAAFHVGWGSTRQDFAAEAACLVAMTQSRFIQGSRFLAAEAREQVDYWAWVADISTAVERVRGGSTECGVHCQLLREILGDPFRLIPIESSWLTATVTALALAAYEERSLPSGSLHTDRLSILADALEDAGCTEAAILEHLRGPGPHYRGCWAVDALLAKQ
jgi:hypothetical protein